MKLLRLLLALPYLNLLLAAADLHSNPPQRWPDPHRVDESVRAELEAIQLGDPGDPEAVRQYISELGEFQLRMLRERRTTGLVPGVEERYREVGSEHVPLLVRALSERGAPSYGAIHRAIATLATEEHDPLILEEFQRHQGLADAVTALNLQKDAFPTMLYWLNQSEASPSGFVLPEIFKTVAEAQDPATFPVLLRAFENSRDPSFLKYLGHVPAADVYRSLLTVWSAVREDRFHRSPVPDFSSALAERGNTAALRFMFDQIGETRGDVHRNWQVGDYVARIRRVTDAPPELDRQGLYRWYSQNWRQLQFDPARRKWALPGARPMRVWTDVEGRTIMAELISAAEDSVTIMRSDGRIFLLSLERLSEADREHVKQETSLSAIP